MGFGGRRTGYRDSNATLRQVAGAEQRDQKDGGKELHLFFHREPSSERLQGLIIVDDEENMHPSIAQRRGVHPYSSAVIIELAGHHPNIHPLNR